jgi:class 3 adenylate cyclase
LFLTPSETEATGRAVEKHHVERQNGPFAGSSLSEDAWQEILLLASRLKAQHGQLDDAAVLAVAEATGAPEDFVRLAVRSARAARRETLVERLKASFVAFDPTVRRLTMAGVFGIVAGLASAIGSALRDASGFMGSIVMLAVLAAAWNSGVAKTPRDGALAGAAFGGVGFLVSTMFTFLFGFLPNVSQKGPPSFMLLVVVLAGLVAGAGAQGFVNTNRKRLGIKDPVEERQELLAQLAEIQERLRSDERFVTFMSVDIVGSTRHKEDNDPLDVEFTFGEYHRFVQTVAERFGGRLHSTAGDGVTCVFEVPAMAYAAGRALLSGLFEFNSYRNKLKSPIDVRAGINTGSVHAPGQSLTSVNFAHVIDVAAHLQKAGEPGTLVVGESTAQYLPGGLEGLGGEVIETHYARAAVWRPRHRLLALARDAHGS